MIWFGSCVGSIASPFFYFSKQALFYHFGIGSLLVSNVIELSIFFILRYAFIWENVRKEKLREAQRAQGVTVSDNETAFQDLTNKENNNFVYIY